MRPGKLSPHDLTTIIFPRRGMERPDVLVHPALGQDAAVVDFGSEVAVLSSDPITGAGQDAGWLAVHIAVNDVAACGARPVGVLMTMLLAPETARADAHRLMEEANRAARELGIEILGGHSEITAGLSRSLVVLTALGRAARDRYVTAAGARPGDTLLLTKAAGLEGTAILAADFPGALAGSLPLDLLARARAFRERISIVPEALAAVEAGATAMHDATEGGILGAASELAAAAGVGVEIDADRVPVLPETRAICEAVGIDPLALVSSGALLITTPRPDAVIRSIASRGCPVTAIGRVVAGRSRLRRGGFETELLAPERDALWDAIERLERG
ncbi:MAG: AIR synthase family protein [Chloroflexi bacterium]|nr:AIR synthase family protein [Chloroflexota bacterium]